MAGVEELNPKAEGRGPKEGRKAKPRTAKALERAARRRKSRKRGERRVGDSDYDYDDEKEDDDGDDQEEDEGTEVARNEVLCGILPGTNNKGARSGDLAPWGRRDLP
jgi:hypothetical protein